MSSKNVRKGMCHPGWELGLPRCLGRVLPISFLQQKAGVLKGGPKALEPGLQHRHICFPSVRSPRGFASQTFLPEHSPFKTKRGFSSVAASPRSRPDLLWVALRSSRYQCGSTERRRVAVGGQSPCGPDLQRTWSSQWEVVLQVSWTSQILPERFYLTRWQLNRSVLSPSGEWDVRVEPSSAT